MLRKRSGQLSALPFQSDLLSSRFRTPSCVYQQKKHDAVLLVSFQSGVVAGVAATKVMISPMFFKQFLFTITMFSVQTQGGGAIYQSLGTLPFKMSISLPADGVLSNVNKKGAGSGPLKSIAARIVVVELGTQGLFSHWLHVHCSRAQAR